MKSILRQGLLAQNVMNFAMKIDIFFLLPAMTPDHPRSDNRLGPFPEGRHPWGRVRTIALRTADVLIVVLALVAMVSLVAEHGFYLSDEWLAYAHLATKAVLYGFLLHLLLILGFSGERRDYLRTHRIEVAIGVLIVLHLALPGTMASILRALDPAVTPEFLARVYVVLMQVMLVLALIPSAVRFSTSAMGTYIQPASLIAIGFLAAILLGAGLLLLPRATAASQFSLIDAFFTSTSAVCVTGLTVVDTATTFTRTGHVILLFLMQVGGLGIMTLTTFFAFMAGSRGSLKQYSTLQSLLGADSIGRIRGVVLRIGLTTLGIELAGAVAIWFSLGDTMSGSPRDRVFFAIFHSVSAFCNAGFALTTENLAAGPLHANMVFLSSIMLLIVLGGLGFPVLLNLARLLPRRKVHAYQRRLSLHSLIVLIATGTLILLGTIVFFLLERDRWLAGLPPLEQLLTALFHSISARTAGFNTLPVQTLGPASLLFLIMLMWIGASPGSTGGGVKTTTVVVAILAIRSIVTGRGSIEAFRNRIPNRALLQAFSTIALSMGVIGLALFIMLLLEPMPFTFLLFEVVSALGTVGLSADVTPHLSVAGKLVIATVIFVGRIGVLSFLLALTGQRKEEPYEYTEEPVHIT
jgi:Trk-type K+ transport system membrane component